MKWILTGMLFFATLAAFLPACNNTVKVNQQPAADTAHYTTVQWLDSVVNFGSIKMGEQIEIRFRVRNSGHQPLYLTDVKAVCGCTVADYTRQAISPGDTGIVVGSFDSKKAHVGTVRKSILATTNSRNGYNHDLIFTGDIQE